MAKKRKPVSKERRILARYVETQVMQGVDITGFFAKPMNHWNFDFMQEQIKQHDIMCEAGLQD